MLLGYICIYIYKIRLISKFYEFIERRRKTGYVQIDLVAVRIRAANWSWASAPKLELISMSTWLPFEKAILRDGRCGSLSELRNKQVKSLVNQCLIILLHVAENHFFFWKIIFFFQNGKRESIFLGVRHTRVWQGLSKDKVRRIRGGGKRRQPQEERSGYGAWRGLNLRPGETW